MATLLDLVCESVIGSYLSWAINDKEIAINSLSCFGVLLAAVRHYPKYKTIDFRWFANLLDQIPEESQAVVDQRKQKKYLSHAELSKNPK